MTASSLQQGGHVLWMTPTPSPQSNLFLFFGWLPKHFQKMSIQHHHSYSRDIVTGLSPGLGEDFPQSHVQFSPHGLSTCCPLQCSNHITYTVTLKQRTLWLHPVQSSFSFQRFPVVGPSLIGCAEHEVCSLARTDPCRAPVLQTTMSDLLSRALTVSNN